MSRSSKEITPRNGHTLKVLIVARISGGVSQKEQSLKDQVDHAKTVIAELYQGPVEYVIISTTGKGERIDRPELEEVRVHLRSRTIDVMVAEDAGRIVRGTESKAIVGLAVDYKTRVLLPNDDIDTHDPTWETDLIGMCKENVGANEHTSKRLKNKLMNRFMKGLGATHRETAGYIVPDDAKRYEDWSKDESATDIFKRWFHMMKDGAGYREVSRWLNLVGFKPGPYAKNKSWDGRMVARQMKNAILKGFPGRGFRHTIKIHGVGARPSVKNPNGPNFVEYPHLAHLEPAFFDEVNALVAARNAGMGRKTVGGRDPRADVSKKSTNWPGQHAVCGVCGRIYYWGGHGAKGKLMCSGAKDSKCWNGTSYNGAAGAKKMLVALLDAVEALPDFDAALKAKLEAEAVLQNTERDGQLQVVNADLAHVQRGIDNLADAIETMGGNKTLQDKLAQAEDKKAQLERRRQQLSKADEAPIVLPAIEVVKASARRLLGAGDFADDQFRRTMKQLVPKIELFPCQLLDGGGVRLRAKLTIQLVPLAPDHRRALELLPLQEVMVDLFDLPQRAEFGTKIVAMRNSGMTERSVAKELGLTITATQRAKTLHERSLAEGRADLYVYLKEPLADCRKGACHLNEVYSFQPLPGYPTGP